MTASDAPTDLAPAALHWRALAALYDALPVLALWLVVSALALWANGNRPFAPFSPGQWLLWAGCWTVTGGYAVVSWRRGGQTLGMRPWRLRVRTPEGTSPTIASLILRYTVSTLSLAAFGLGYFWSLIDPQRRTWHDLASGTMLVRTASRSR